MPPDAAIQNPGFETALGTEPQGWRYSHGVGEVASDVRGALGDTRHRRCVTHGREACGPWPAKCGPALPGVERVGGPGHLDEPWLEGERGTVAPPGGLGELGHRDG